MEVSHLYTPAEKIKQDTVCGICYVPRLAYSCRRHTILVSSADSGMHAHSRH